MKVTQDVPKKLLSSHYRFMKVFVLVCTIIEMLTSLFLEKRPALTSLFHLQLIMHCQTMYDEVSQNIN